MRADSNQFKFDYRPVIITFAIFTILHGLFWYAEPDARYSAHVFYSLKLWAEYLGLSVHHWGLPMVLGGTVILVGMIIKIWQVRWVGYAISSLTFLTIAESFRQSATLFSEASTAGLRTYIFLGTLPIVLAGVAVYYANERRGRNLKP